VVHAICYKSFLASNIVAWSVANYLESCHSSGKIHNSASIFVYSSGLSLVFNIQSRTNISSSRILAREVSSQYYPYLPPI
jgi:hypothetical protein